MARCILFQADLQMSFWAEAVHAANYLRNRCASRSLEGRTPYEKWIGKTPDLRHLRVIGTKAFVLDKTPAKGKFDARAKEGVLVGYSEVSKGYRVWVHSENRVIITRDIKFHTELDSDCANTEEIILKDFIEEDCADTNTKTPANIVEAEAAPNAIQEPNVEMRRTPGRPRILRTGSRGRPRKEFRFTSSGNTANENTGQNGDSIDESTIEISDSDTLSNDNEADVEDDVFHEANLAIASAKVAEVQLQEAMTGPQANEWLDAIVTEFKNILAQDTWELVERPMDRTVIGCRLILTTKLGPDGMLSRRKARLVARGFLQRPGIDLCKPMHQWQDWSQCD